MAVSDRTLARRAAANLARGLGGSLPFALLPPVLARLLPDAEFAVWVIVVQLASYVAYLELGVQTAVSRTVAFASNTGDATARRQPIAAGVQLLGAFAAAAIVLVAVATAALTWLFDVPPDLQTGARTGFAILGVSAALALPGSAMHGAMLGIGRNGTSAVVVVICRLCSVVLTVTGAAAGWPIPWLALALASGTLLGAVAPFVAARAVGLPVAVRGEVRAAKRELFALTVTLGIWTVATLIITGLDVVIVGAVDFDRVAAYGLAASLIVIVSAGYGIMFSVLLPAFAEFTAGDRRADAERLLVRSTRLSSSLLAAGLIVTLAVQPVLLEQWAGQYADDAQVVLTILLIAAVVRLSMTPLMTFLMGAGDHRIARYPALLEAVVNLLLSIALGLWLGATGVALATLLAASIVIVVDLAIVAPKALGRTAATALVRRGYGGSAAIAAVAVPLILVRTPALTITATAVAVATLAWSGRRP